MQVCKDVKRQSVLRFRSAHQFPLIEILLGYYFKGGGRIRNKQTCFEKIRPAEQARGTNCLLSFLAFSHKKKTIIFACENNRFLTQKKESEHVCAPVPAGAGLIF